MSAPDRIWIDEDDNDLDLELEFSTVLELAPLTVVHEGWTPPTDRPTVELSIVLPCLNEAETLAICIRKAQMQIAELGIDGEVIVADNGPTDGSRGIAAGLGARLVPVATRGYGAALRGGIDAARGRYVIMADADDSYALDDLGPFVESLRAGNELVMGNRFRGGIAPGAMKPLHRYVGNPVLSFVGRRFFRTDIGDFHCGMRGFDRDAIRGLGLSTSGMEFASEMVVRSSLSGLRIAEVPTTLKPDGRSRAPHLRTWTDGWRHLRFLLAFSPRWLFLYPGLLLAMVGTLGLGVLGGGARSIGPLRLDLQTMLFFAVATAIGLQAMWLALIAKVHAINAGMHPPDRRVDRMLTRVTLERGLVIGFLIVLAGLAGLIYQVIAWARSDFGTLDVYSSMRVGILSAVGVLVGGQTIMSSFTLSLVARRNQ